MNRRSTTTRTRIAALGATAALCGAFAMAGTAQAAVATDTRALRDAVTVSGIMTHLNALQSIADANHGTRQAGTIGHEASVYYIDVLLEAVGYSTTGQPFDF